jgi:hypothetical protein
MSRLCLKCQWQVSAFILSHHIDTQSISQVNATSTGSRSPPPELTNEDLLAMVQEFRPFGSFEHSTCKFSIVDLLSLC